MSVPLTQQLECARAVLETMRAKNSRWTEAQEGVVATVEKALLLKEVGDEMLAADKKKEAKL